MEPTQDTNVAKYTGKMSWFGGPHDMGVKPSEGLALYTHDDIEHHPSLFLPNQPPGTSGTARRLNPEAYFCAMRWNYHVTPESWLRKIQVKVTNTKGESVLVYPVDWGPNIDTHRIIDLSPGAVKALRLNTNDTVMVEVPLPQ